jgi:hypothetical protein
MMAGVILACSVVAMLQFFIWYCRSLVAASAKHALSAEVRDVTGIASSASGADFPRVRQLLNLCPEQPEERNGIEAVGAYFSFLGVIRSTVARVIPSLRSWADLQQAQCAYFAAVALDRRIAFNRSLMAQQMDA